MDNQFVPYEQALELKELGFDEKCFKYCLLGVGIIGKQKESDYLLTPVKNSELERTSYTIPLWQQAFDWFREKHRLVSWVYEARNEGCPYFILRDGRYLSGYTEPLTYKEARLECLKKLIEIIKNK